MVTQERDTKVQSIKLKADTSEMNTSGFMSQHWQECLVPRDAALVRHSSCLSCLYRSTKLNLYRHSDLLQHFITEAPQTLEAQD